MVVGKRWLSLAGLAILLLGIPLGNATRSGWVTMAALVLGIGLMLIQIPLTVRYYMRLAKGPAGDAAKPDSGANWAFPKKGSSDN